MPLTNWRELFNRIEDIYQSLITGTAIVGIGTGELPATGTHSSFPASNTTAAQVLAANTNRKGASIVVTANTSTLYLLMSASGTVSATLHSTRLDATTFQYNVPFGYTGVINGVWDANDTTTAIVTEYT